MRNSLNTRDKPAKTVFLPRNKSTLSSEMLGQLFEDELDVGVCMKAA
jgi:hypothetical protein